MNWTTTATLRWISLSPVNLKVLQPLWSTAKLMWTWWIRVAGASCTRPSKEVRRVWDLFHSNQRFAGTLCLAWKCFSVLFSRGRVCLHLSDSALGSGECSHSGRGGDPAPPGLLFQPQETLCRSYDWNGKDRRCPAEDRSEPQHAEQQGQVGRRTIFKLIEIDTSCLEYDGHSIWLSFVVQQNSTARSCGVGKRASVQPVAAVQTVSLVWLHLQSWNTVNDKWRVNISVNER